MVLRETEQPDYHIEFEPLSLILIQSLSDSRGEVLQQKNDVCLDDDCLLIEVLVALGEQANDVDFQVFSVFEPLLHQNQENHACAHDLIRASLLEELEGGKLLKLPRFIHHNAFESDHDDLDGNHQCTVHVVTETLEEVQDVVLEDVLVLIVAQLLDLEHQFVLVVHKQLQLFGGDFDEVENEVNDDFGYLVVEEIEALVVLRDLVQKLETQNAQVAEVSADRPLGLFQEPLDDEFSGLAEKQVGSRVQFLVGEVDFVGLFGDEDQNVDDFLLDLQEDTLDLGVFALVEQLLQNAVLEVDFQKQKHLHMAQE